VKESSGIGLADTRFLFARIGWLVGAVLALSGGYAVARPHISVDPSLSLSSRDPYTTQFTVKNENPIFDAQLVHCVCWPREMESGNGFSVISPVTLPNLQHTIPILNPGSSSTVDCPPIIGGLGEWSGEVMNAELEIVVTYDQTWWPFGSVVKRFAFATRRDAQHGVHWVPITPLEEMPILPGMR
jgi:hypothetical protein